MTKLLNTTDTQLRAINEKIDQLSYGFGADLRTKRQQEAENADFQRRDGRRSIQLKLRKP